MQFEKHPAKVWGRTKPTTLRIYPVRLRSWTFSSGKNQLSYHSVSFCSKFQMPTQFSDPHPYLCAKFQDQMGFSSFKSLLVIAFGAFSMLLSIPVFFAAWDNGNNHAENRKEMMKKTKRRFQCVRSHLVMYWMPTNFISWYWRTPGYHSAPRCFIFQSARSHNFYVFQVWTWP